MPNNDLPLVSLLLVVRNEKAALVNILNSYVAQTYPRIEIVVVDGESTDGTKEAAEEILRELQKSRRFETQILDNPEKILASGWSLGIRASKGEYICRIDAHSEIAPDYIEKATALLRSKQYQGAISIGGVIAENIASSSFGRLSADLFGSKFGIGNSRFRNPPKTIVESDTSGFGVFRRSELAKYEFNTSLKRNQDVELIKRIRADGWKLYINPEMHVRYETRTSLGKLMKKGFNDGFWIPFSGGYLRHMIPLLFFIYLLTAIVFSVCFYLTSIGNGVVLLPLALYCLLAIVFAIKDGSTLWSKLFLPFLFFLYHMVYGFGSFCGYCQKLYLLGKFAFRFNKILNVLFVIAVLGAG